MTLRITHAVSAILLAAVLSTAVAETVVVRYEGVCDASAAVALDRDHFVLAEDEGNVLLTYRIGAPAAIGQGLDLNAHLGIRPSKKKHRFKEADIEGSARIGDRIYWIASHGRDGKGNLEPTRLRFFATTVIASRPVPRVEPVGLPFMKLLDALAADGRFSVLTNATRFAPESDKGLNIEGLAATPEGGLLIGFRNPREGGMALLLPLANPADVIDRGAAPVFGDLVRLDLEGRGIRSIEGVDDGYVIVGGPHDDRSTNAKALSAELYRWQGGSSRPTRVVPSPFGTLNPEAVFSIPGTRELVVLSDDGGVRVGGVACKNEAVPRSSKGFRGITIPLPPAAVR